jgi:putative flippase GtrA
LAYLVRRVGVALCREGWYAGRMTSDRPPLAVRLSVRRSKRTLSLKAISFALVGVVNTLVDYSVFLAARAVFSRLPGAQVLFDSVSATCGCADPTTVSLVAANIVSWAVAVTGSYILNSSITFAAESGRKLRWRSYLIFVASGIVGWLANTTTLVFAAQVLQLPVWLAKAIAILASFVVNFSLSHFVVFRVRGRPAGDVAAVDAREDV